MPDTAADRMDQLDALFNLARKHKKLSQETQFAECAREFAESAATILKSGEQTDRLCAMLYHLNRYELFDQAIGAPGSGDLPAILAVSAAFACGEIPRALTLAKKIQDPEQRRLRQKSAQLWADLAAPLTAEPRVHLLILTCNRAEYVENALRELGKTAYRNYAVYIADNGSSDGTRKIAARAREFFPAHIPVEFQAFPTNIGRPGGHNWLLTGHDHSKADFIAIGDDDLFRVPSNWLTRMVRTAQVFAGCACVGGKALSPGWPVGVHGAPFHFTRFGPHTCELSNQCEQDDLGQFDYVDLVDHVIGCLHIFDRQELEKAGFFDIRFSPCQCVDVEHHLRMCLAGQRIVFNGFIAFEHMRVTGRAVLEDDILMGNVAGNVIKFLAKYDQKVVAECLEKRRRDRAAWLAE